MLHTQHILCNPTHHHASHSAHLVQPYSASCFTFSTPCATPLSIMFHNQHILCSPNLHLCCTPICFMQIELLHCQSRACVLRTQAHRCRYQRLLHSSSGGCSSSGTLLSTHFAACLCLALCLYTLHLGHASCVPYWLMYDLQTQLVDYPTPPPPPAERLASPPGFPSARHRPCQQGTSGKVEPVAADARPPASDAGDSSAPLEQV